MSHDANNTTTTPVEIEPFDELEIPEGDGNALNALFAAHQPLPRQPSDEETSKASTEAKPRSRSRSPISRLLQLTPEAAAKISERQRGGGLIYPHNDRRLFNTPRQRAISAVDDEAMAKMRRDICDGLGIDPTFDTTSNAKHTEKPAAPMPLCEIPGVAVRLTHLERGFYSSGRAAADLARRMLDSLPPSANIERVTAMMQSLVDAVDCHIQAKEFGEYASHQAMAKRYSVRD